MKTVFTILLLGSLVACTLDSKQEEKLSKAFNSYINASNKDLTLELVAFTHVAIVKHYKSEGDSAFIHHFHQDKKYPYYYGNYFIRDTKEEGNEIQRMYTVEKYNDSTEINPKYRIYAISSNKGKTWFFANEDDYFDPKIPLKKRLFKK